VRYNLHKSEFYPWHAAERAFMGNLTSGGKDKSEGQIIAVKESNASRLVWANHDLIHEIMDFLTSFKELTLIPRIRQDTSDSLFSYRFKNREFQKYDWDLFLNKALTYYDSFINKGLRTRKSGILSLNRPDNYRRLANMKFYSINTALSYMDENRIKVLSNCNELILKNFYPSQLSLICKPNISFLVSTLTLQIGEMIEYDEKFEGKSIPIETALSNVTAVNIKGGKASGSTFSKIGDILARLPSLQALNLLTYTLPKDVIPLLPKSLTVLAINVFFGFRGDMVDLSYLAVLRELFIYGRNSAPKCILLPESLEYLSIPDSLWHENQQIPSNVKRFHSQHSKYDLMPQFSYMQTAVEKSNIEHINLFAYDSLRWSDFKIPPSLKSIECSPYLHLIKDIKQSGLTTENNRFTHLFFTPYRLSAIFCGKNVQDVPYNLDYSSWEDMWYHIPLEHIRVDGPEIIMPIPGHDCRAFIYRLRDHPTV
jgi:hypothetical protein